MMPGIPKSSASPLIKASIPAGDQLVEPVIGAKLLSLSTEPPQSGTMAMSLTCTHSTRGQSCQGFITSLCAAVLLVRTINRGHLGAIASTGTRQA